MNRVTARRHIGLAIALAAALLLRAYKIGQEDYWLDELHSMANSAGHRGELDAIPHGVIVEELPRYTDLTDDSSWQLVWRTLEHDSHPPAYFLILHTWRRMFGDSETATRMLPTILSVLSIALVVLIARELGRCAVMPWIAGALAVAFSHLHMAQENRPYSLGLLFVCLAFFALTRIQRFENGRPRSRRVLDVALLAGAIFFAMMSHYFTALPLIAMAVYVLVFARRAALQSWTIAAAVAAAGWCVIWGPSFLAQLDFISSQPWVMEERSDHVWRTFMRLGDLPIRLMFGHEPFTFSVERSLVGAAILTGALVWLLRERIRVGWLFALWYLVPVAAFALIDLTTGRQLLSHIRYSSVTAPGLVGWLVLAVASIPRLPRIGVIGAFALIVAATLWPLPATDNPASRYTAGLLTQQLRVDDLLVYDAIDWPPHWASRLQCTIGYYIPDPHPPFVMLRERPDEELRQAMGRFDRILVVSPDPDSTPDPAPQTHRLTGRSDFIHQIGWVYVFTRSTRPE